MKGAPSANSWPTFLPVRAPGSALPGWSHGIITAAQRCVITAILPEAEAPGRCRQRSLNRALLAEPSPLPGGQGPGHRAWAPGSEAEAMCSRPPMLSLVWPWAGDQAALGCKSPPPARGWPGGSGHPRAQTWARAKATLGRPEPCCSLACGMPEAWLKVPPQASSLHCGPRDLCLPGGGDRAQALAPFVSASSSVKRENHIKACCEDKQTHFPKSTRLTI